MLSRPTRSAPPLAFVVFWNAFTAVHAFFMLRGMWGSWAMLVLLPFYGLFFGVGIWMIRAWLRAQALGQEFGSPTLQPLAPVVPGQQLRLGVDFDRDWTMTGLQLSAQLCWVEVLSKGGSGKVLAAAAVGGSALAGARSTTWQGMAVVPVRPAGAQPMRLELLLQPADAAPGSGWRFQLPLAAQQPGLGEAIEFTPEMAGKADRVLGWIFLGLLVAGGALLLQALTSGHRAFLPLLPGAGLAFAAWVVSDLRSALAAAAAEGGGSATPEQMAPRMALLKADLRRRARLFMALVAAAVVADFLGLLEKF